MRVYLLRHGTAEDSPPAGGTDDDRELTADGITKLKRCAPGLRRLVDAEVVLTSPLRRSQLRSGSTPVGEPACSDT